MATCGQAAGVRGVYAGPTAQCKRVLNDSYERRFGSPQLLDHSANISQLIETPRQGKKCGTPSFSDPRNPNNRTISKRMLRSEAAKLEKDRAGARTKNPGVIPAEVSSTERPGLDGRNRLVPHRYSTTSDWRPAKRMTDAPPCTGLKSQSPRCSEGVSAALQTLPAGSRAVLENYLNDMKRGRTTRRQLHGKPSEALQRMSDERHCLPSERVERRRDQSRSLSRDLRRSAESDNEDCYGFDRKRDTSGPWTGRSFKADFLYHPEAHHADRPLRRAASARPASARPWREPQRHEALEDAISLQSFRSELDSTNLRPNISEFASPRSR